ncbi:hypothetical protein SIXOD_v1c13220 [Spiroplasma ixodetis Y32]|nr:hypothetical protein SIXOD_v1c13220 [Spiroplasma ixodetis Y32]
MIIYPICITIRNVKILKGVGSYIISAPPRTGKSVLACCLAQTHKKRVVSPFPIKLKNGYSYFVNYNDVFTFNQLASDYAFEEQDLIMAFLPLCTIFKFYHINAEKSLSTDFSPHF